MYNTPVHEPKVVSFKDRDEWKAIRFNTIGGSEIAALFESVANESPVDEEDDDFDYEHEGEPVSPYLSPLSLWALKTGRYRATEKSNDRINWGNIMEPLIAGNMAKKYEWVLKAPKGYYIHPDIPNLGASLDFELDIDGVGEDIPFEIKNVAADQRWKWKNSTGDWMVPAHIMMQIQQQLCVTGRAVAYVGVLFGGSEDRFFVVERDEELIAEIEKTVTEFWWYVENNVPPEPNYQRDAKVINRLYTHSTPTDVADWTQDQDVQEMIASMKNHGSIANQNKKAADEIRAKLMVRMGNYAAADLGDTLLKAIMIDGGDVTYTREPYVRLSVSKKPVKHGGSPLKKKAAKKA